MFEVGVRSGVVVVIVSIVAVRAEDNLSDKVCWDILLDEEEEV